MVPVLWLGIYLFLGVVALWACRNSSACRRRARLDRDHRIISSLGSLFGHGESVNRLAAPAKASARS
ncbi:MAG TPA: hypothetical protein VHL54_12175 [Actinomycetota bacterium]|nr:hypothetical protein [Actinomycetota bacterium]